MLPLHYIYSVNNTEYINNIKNSKIFYVIPVWDQQVIKEFFTNSNQINKNKVRPSWLNNHDSFYFYLTHRYNDSDSLQETLWRIKCNIEVRPTCLNCGGYVNFAGNGEFKRFCSPHCGSIHISTQEKMKKTCKERYGVEYSLQNSEIKEKSKNTCREKYGVDYVFQNKSIQEKSKKTIQERYGVDHPMHSDIIKEKSKNTCKEKYGDSHVWGKNSNVRYKTKETCEKIYGKDYLKSDEIKNKKLNTYLRKYGCTHSTHSPEVQEKSKKTCKEKYNSEYAITSEIVHNKIIYSFIEKYGVNSYAKTQEYKDLYKNPEFVKNKTEKEYITKHKNNSFNASKPEDHLYEVLISHYPDTLRQYRSEVYPFNCDFYIPSLDLYIEYNGHWTHGSHPYDLSSKEDNEKLNLWISKHTKFYDIAIKIWTISDPLKRQIAKDNNLNFIELWNKEDIEKITDEFYD